MLNLSNRLIKVLSHFYILHIFVFITLFCVGCYFPEVTLSKSEQTEIEQHLLSHANTVKPQYHIGAEIEGQVRFIGFDLDKKEARPGEVVTITYYLEGLNEETLDCKIFVHLQGKKTGAWQNLDHTPIRGLFPLRKLRRGQVIKDVQRFKIKQGYPAGEARIFWGLFTTQRRLKIDNLKAVKHDHRDRVLLGTLNVLAPRPPAKVEAYGLAPQDQIMIDGKLNEPSWLHARWSRLWVDPLGRQRGKRGLSQSPPVTRAKFLWASDALYIAIEARDRDIWATFTERDSNTWEQEVVEVFLDPDGDKRDYLELQVSPANVVFDARFAYHRSDLKKARSWNYQGWETAVDIEGTLNQRTDRDQRYVVEMRLPLATLPGAPKTLSSDAKSWRINLFRFDWDEAPKGRQRAAALSPTYVGDFHALDAFAELSFKPTEAPKRDPLPASTSNTTPYSSTNQTSEAKPDASELAPNKP